MAIELLDELGNYSLSLCALCVIIVNSMNSDILKQIAKDADGWDELDTLIIQLENATLVVDTPKLKAGTKVDVITFVLEHSRCEIKDKDGNILDEFDLVLSIKKTPDQ